MAKQERHNIDYTEEGDKYNRTEAIKYMFLHFMQELFSQQEQYTWDSDEEKSDILITDQMPDDMSVVEKKPMIVLFRGPMRPMQSSIDQLEKITLKKGVKRYSDLWSGQIRFECIARFGLEAETIATRVALALVTFKDILRERGLHDYREVTIGEEGAMEVDSEIVSTVVSVTLQYTAQFTWKVTTDAEELKDFEIGFCIDSGDIPEDTIYQKTEGEDPPG